MDSIVTARYFSVNNVFTLTGYTGGDPANINVNGVEPGIETTSIYPVACTFTLGLSVHPKDLHCKPGCSNTTRKALSGKPSSQYLFCTKSKRKRNNLIS